MPVSRLDYSLLADQAREAESLLGHRIFGLAMDRMKQSLMDQIIALPLGSEKLTHLHTKLKLLDEFRGELKAIVADFRLARKPE